MQMQLQMQQMQAVQQARQDALNEVNTRTRV